MPRLNFEEVARTPPDILTDALMSPPTTSLSFATPSVAMGSVVTFTVAVVVSVWPLPSESPTDGRV